MYTSLLPKHARGPNPKASWGPALRSNLCSSLSFPSGTSQRSGKKLDMLLGSQALFLIRLLGLIKVSACPRCSDACRRRGSSMSKAGLIMLGPPSRASTTVPCGTWYPRSSVSTVACRSTKGEVQAQRRTSSTVASRYGMRVLIISSIVGSRFSAFACWKDRCSTSRSILCASALSVISLRSQHKVVAVVPPPAKMIPKSCLVLAHVIDCTVAVLCLLHQR